MGKLETSTMITRASGQGQSLIPSCRQILGRGYLEERRLNGKVEVIRHVPAGRESNSEGEEESQGGQAELRRRCRPVYRDGGRAGRGTEKGELRTMIR